MAERKTEDDFNPRHRIVGAVILVALAVIFLPLLLQERQPEEPATDVPLPETPTAAAITATPGSAPKPVAEPSASRPNTRTVTVALDPVDSSRPIIKKPLTEPAPPAEPPRVEAKPEPAPARTETKPRLAATDTRASGWYIQVGVFSQAENARRLQDKLAASGYHVVTDPSRFEKGKTIKVEVGPYSDQGRAKTAAARIENDFSIDTVVRKH